MLSAALSFAYAGLMFVLALVAAPFFLLSQRGRVRLAERFGYWNLPEQTYLWFHGASMGEIGGVLPVIRALREAHPEAKILVTATSVTGLERAAGEAHETRLLPFDSRWYLRRALRGAQIKALIVTETELWPELIGEVSSRGAALYMINAIVSDLTISRYRAVRILLAPLLRRFNAILCGSEQSRARLLELGAASDAILVTGNSKYDVQPSVTSEDRIRELKTQYFKSCGTRVLVLGSLRPGEENLWFPEMGRALSRDDQLSVIVAPRHKEKFEFFAQRLREFDIPFRRRSEPAGSDNERVVLLDTYGELESAYSFADAVFVGGSLVDAGGHNPLEPACYGAYIAMGPFSHKVGTIAAELEQAAALRRVASCEDIRILLDEMRKNPAMFKAQGESARGVWRAHRGATAKIIEHLQRRIA